MPFHPPLSLTRTKRPIDDLEFHQGKGDPFVGFESPHLPDRVPGPVHRFPLQNHGLKVLYGLFYPDLLF